MSGRAIATRVAHTVIAVVLGGGICTSALADLFYLNEFVVDRNNATIFVDSFNRNALLNGSPPAVVPSGANFSNGTPANYFVTGTIPESTGNNGQAQLNTANGLVRTQPDPFLPVIQMTSATLQTGNAALVPGALFSSTAEFDLAAPSTLLGTYGIYLANPTGYTVELRLRECAAGLDACGSWSGPVLQFMWLDFVSNSAIKIADVALTSGDLAHAQIALLLSHGSVNNDVITAAYAFGDSSGNFGSYKQLGATSSSMNVFSDSGYVRAGFEAYAPIPAPGTLGLAALGLTALGFGRRRRH